MEDAASQNCKYGLYAGLGIAGIFFAMLASYSLGFWYGGQCVIGSDHCPEDVSGQDYSPGDVLIIFFSILMAGFNMSQLTPAFKKIV